MASLPQREQQIIRAHASLIVHTVRACTESARCLPLEVLLQAAEGLGHRRLVSAVRRVLAGARREEDVGEVDADERVVVQAILRGLRDPSSLPDLMQPADPQLAAPAIAGLILQAAAGDPAAQRACADMAAQMQTVGGDMAHLGVCLPQIIAGERDVERLAAAMTAAGTSLVTAILGEMAKQDLH